MKKQFQHGFWAGLLTAGLLLALGLTVLAAGRTISIDDGIRITFNGAAFTPKDANGKPVVCSPITAPPTPPCGPSVRRRA